MGTESTAIYFSRISRISQNWHAEACCHADDGGMRLEDALQAGCLRTLRVFLCKVMKDFDGFVVGGKMNLADRGGKVESFGGMVMGYGLLVIELICKFPMVKIGHFNKREKKNSAKRHDSFIF